MSDAQVTPILKSEKNAMSQEENQKGIENHKLAAKHLQQSAEHHTEAAMHHEAGNHEKASESTVKAHGHQSLANEAQKADMKQHALKS
jgi:hypothetical protein